MLRFLFLLFIALLISFVVSKGRSISHSPEKPIFLKADRISQNHSTQIEISINSLIHPDSIDLIRLKNDYSNIWAHMNHLYATNDIIKGKEYYTERWFKQIAKHYENAHKTIVIREDIQHELQIENWSSDGLACIATDRNVILNYYYPNQTSQSTRANILIVLLFQGDHWRIDAMKILNEEII